MTFEDILLFYKTGRNFTEKTGISVASFYGWQKGMPISIASQFIIEKLSKGALKADIIKKPADPKNKKLAKMEKFKFQYEHLLKKYKAVFRYHRNTFNDSMRTSIGIDGLDDLNRLILDHVSEFIMHKFISLDIKKYCYDTRINRDCHLVVVNFSYEDESMVFPVGFLVFKKGESF